MSQCNKRCKMHFVLLSRPNSFYIRSASIFLKAIMPVQYPLPKIHQQQYNSATTIITNTINFSKCSRKNFYYYFITHCFSENILRSFQIYTIRIYATLWAHNLQKWQRGRSGIQVNVFSMILVVGKNINYQVPAVFIYQIYIYLVFLRHSTQLLNS